jgi:hypothetical protein
MARELRLLLEDDEPQIRMAPQQPVGGGEPDDAAPDDGEVEAVGQNSTFGTFRASGGASK